MKTRGRGERGGQHEGGKKGGREDECVGGRSVCGGGREAASEQDENIGVSVSCLRTTKKDAQACGGHFRRTRRPNRRNINKPRRAYMYYSSRMYIHQI